jgi:hypothetical protein
MNQEVKDFGLALAHSQAILTLAQAKMKNQCKHTTALESLYRELEAMDGLPEGFDIPQMPEAPQEYSSGLDKELILKAGD